MTYNDSGYPIGYNITNGKSFADHRVIWNENKTPKSINTYSTLSPSKYTQTIEFFYGDNQFLPVKVIAVTENGKKTNQTKIECEYSDYELDDKGNWISRNVTETVTKKGKETTSSFQETRKITY